jgi:Fe-S-cluster-containing hydrogenase component 2
VRSLWVDAQLCTGCGQCLLACSFEKELHFSPVDALLSLVQWEERGFTQPMVCTQCEDAPCAKVCPTEAISRHPESRVWAVDQDLCTACGLCAEACPTGMVFLHRRTEKATICDLCAGQPACVTVCPWGALTFQERSWAELKGLRDYLQQVREATIWAQVPQPSMHEGG